VGFFQTVAVQHYALWFKFHATHQILSFSLELDQVVMECIHKNRIGDVNYSNLALAIQTRTRTVVGEWHWTRARLIILYARQASRKKHKLQQQQNQDGDPRHVASRTA
jgi:hypothetical protein